MERDRGGARQSEIEIGRERDIGDRDEGRYIYGQREHVKDRERETVRGVERERGGDRGGAGQREMGQRQRVLTLGRKNQLERY